MTHTPNPTLAARLAELQMDAHNGSIPEAMKLTHAVRDAYRSGQLITLADHNAAVQAAVEAENEACAKLALAISRPMDGKREKLVHEYTSKTIAAAIRARTALGTTEGKET